MPEAPNNTQSCRPPRRMRWWPALMFLGLAAGGILWARIQHETNRQEGNIHVAVVCLVTFAFLFLWFMFFSRLRWKLRFIGLGCLVGLGLITLSLFKIHGVTGNLVPVLQWRWSTEQGPDLAGLQSSPSGGATHQADTVAGVTPVSLSDAYPQFLGPNRNATLSGPVLERDWATSPPELLWRRPVGPAWSGFAVAGGYAVTQEQQEENELVVCYDLETGQPRWAHPDNARFDSALAGVGPRATPTLDDGRVYAVGATGILNCLDLATGRRLWSTNFLTSNGAKLNSWGMSGSPLVTENFVVVSAGGRKERSLVAYDKGTGAFAWGAGEDGADYSSPCLMTLAGKPQILIFNSSAMASHDPITGEVLWDYPWPKGHPHVAVPVVLAEDEVLISSGYGTGSERVKVERDAAGKLSATRVWKSNRMKAKFTNLVYRDGHVYGLDDGIMACIDVAEGERQWKDGRYGHGQVILAGDLLLVMCENGEVALVDPMPGELRELTRFRALTGKVWNPPALAGATLLVRNDQEAACYRLKVVVGKAQSQGM